MKIIKIEEINSNTFSVTLKPNLIEQLFGFKERIELFKETYDRYVFGGNVYVRQNGKELGIHNKIGKAIDRFQKSF